MCAVRSASQLSTASDKRLVRSWDETWWWWWWWWLLRATVSQSVLRWASCSRWHSARKWSCGFLVFLSYQSSVSSTSSRLRARYNRLYIIATTRHADGNRQTTVRLLLPSPLCLIDIVSVFVRYVTWLVPCRTQWITDHSTPPSSVFCCRHLPPVYLKTLLSFSRSIVQVFLGGPLPLRPWSVHCLVTLSLRLVNVCV